MVLGVAWVLWLAHEREPSGVQSPAPAAVTQSTPASPTGSPSAVSPAGSRPEARPAPTPSSGVRAADTVRAASAAPVRLGFQAPPGAMIGENFDVRVAIDASQPVARIGVEVIYDPAFLRGRTLEEIDYGPRALGERAFKIEEIGDGRAILVLVMKGGEIPRMNVPLVQFEALSPGWTQIRVESINVSDASGRTLTWSATGQESRMSIN